MDCLFCNPATLPAYLVESEYFYVIPDKFPVNLGHTLIISKRCIPTFFDLNLEEAASLHSFTKRVKIQLDHEYRPAGYNLGANCGVFAGQTIMHFHLHVIPRYDGDVENPHGGIRNFKPALVEYDPR